MSEQLSQYPKWMYHKTEPAVIVNDPAEEDALGKGWSGKYEGPETAPAVEEEPPVIDLADTVGSTPYRSGEGVSPELPARKKGKK